MCGSKGDGSKSRQSEVLTVEARKEPLFLDGSENSSDLSPVHILKLHPLITLKYFAFVALRLFFILGEHVMLDLMNADLLISLKAGF